MNLRKYQREDSPIIATWIRTEKEMYQWSADRYGFFPLKPYSVDEHYAPEIDNGRFFPLTMVDENDNDKVVGHLIIRYPEPNNFERVRIGFVVVDPAVRGKGYGSEMIRLAIKYIKLNLTATKADLGVFDNNPNARRCYESVGFKVYGSHTIDTPFGKWNCSDLAINITD